MLVQSSGLTFGPKYITPVKPHFIRRLNFLQPHSLLLIPSRFLDQMIKGCNCKWSRHVLQSVSQTLHIGIGRSVVCSDTADGNGAQPIRCGEKTTTKTTTMITTKITTMITNGIAISVTLLGSERLLAACYCCWLKWSPTNRLWRDNNNNDNKWPGLQKSFDVLQSWADPGSCSPSAYVMICSTVAINAAK